VEILKNREKLVQWWYHTLQISVLCEKECFGIILPEYAPGCGMNDVIGYIRREGFLTLIFSFGRFSGSVSLKNLQKSTRKGKNEEMITKMLTLTK
jgi:hypothetical protein